MSQKPSQHFLTNINTVQYPLRFSAFQVDKSRLSLNVVLYLLAFAEI